MTEELLFKDLFHYQSVNVGNRCFMSVSWEDWYNIKGMNISVIIPTLNGSETIGELLSGLMNQTSKPEEILVIDSGSDDETVRIVKSFGIEHEIIEREAFDHGGTRNMAAERAKGDILVFMSQDAIPCDEHLLENLTLSLRKNVSGASYGRHLPKGDASPMERFARQYNYPEQSIIKNKGDEVKFGIKNYFFSNACSSVRKDAFEAVGGFPCNIPMNEDMILSYRLINAGYSVAYASDAAVYHSHNYSPMKQFKKYFLIGRTLVSSEMAGKVNAHPEGLKFLREGLKFLLREKDAMYIPIFLLDSIFRYAGFNCGMRLKFIPEMKF
jgi:rhamnosyltransferase